MGNQKNRQYQKYVDDFANEWNILGESGGALDPVDGHAAFDASKPVFGPFSRRRHPRMVQYKHAATRRTATGIVYTAAAYNAIGLGDTVSASVQGVALPVTMVVSRKIAEKMPLAGPSANLADI